MKTRSSKTKIFLWKFIPISHPIIYQYQKAKNSFLRCKSHWRSYNSWRPSLIGVSLGFTVIGFSSDFLLPYFIHRDLGITQLVCWEKRFIGYHICYETLISNIFKSQERPAEAKCWGYFQLHMNNMLAKKTVLYEAVTFAQGCKDWRKI